MEFNATNDYAKKMRRKETTRKRKLVKKYLGKDGATVTITLNACPDYEKKRFGSLCKKQAICKNANGWWIENVGWSGSYWNPRCDGTEYKCSECNEIHGSHFHARECFIGHLVNLKMKHLQEALKKEG